MVVAVTAGVAACGNGAESSGDETSSAAITTTEPVTTLPESGTTEAGTTTPTPTPAAIETTIDEVSTAATTVPPLGDPVIGDAVTLPDGSVARLNSYTPNAEPFEYYPRQEPPPEGTTYSRIAVEQCAGAAGAQVAAHYFHAILDDDTILVTVLAFRVYPSLTLPAGACSGGAIDFAVPDGRAVTFVVLTEMVPCEPDGFVCSGDEAARWSVAEMHEVGAPLTAPVPANAAKIGEAVTAPDGSTSTVTAVQTAVDLPGVDPSIVHLIVPPGNIVVQLDVEQCARTAALSLRPSFYLTASNNYTASSLESTLDIREVAPGECVAGSVYYAIPAGTTPAYALSYTLAFGGPQIDKNVGYWAL